MKTPEEIKKGLECCIGDDEDFGCDGCAYCGEMGCVDKMTYDAMIYIQQLEARVPRWIPVEERLPEEKNRVLVYWFDHIFEAMYLWDGNFETLDRQLLLAGRDFTHWMPKPEPPAKGE